jgi:hypothetical protein
MSNIRSPRLVAAGIVALSLLVAGTTFIIPVEKSIADPTAAHWRTFAAALVAMLFLGAATQFLSGLAAFKSGLRAAYRMLASGIILFSVAIVQLPVLGLFNLWDSAWINGGGAILPFVIAAALMYAGLRRFAFLLQLKKWYLSAWTIGGVTIVFTILSAVIANIGIQYSQEGADIYIAVIGWTTAYVLFAALVAQKISGMIGEDYQTSMLRLKVALFALTLSGVHEYSTSFYVHNGQWFVDTGTYLWPFVITGFLLVWAGYAFRLQAVKGIQEAPKPMTSPIPVDGDYLNSITAVADLASRPQDIDLVLDEVRQITSSLSPGQTLTFKDKKRLITVYNRLEQYLLKNDPLRNFTKAELHMRVSPAFRAILESRIQNNEDF